MILKGGYIPRDKLKINSYKLTNEGYALLNLVERVKGTGQKVTEQEQEQPQPTQRATRGTTKRGD